MCSPSDLTSFSFGDIVSKLKMLFEVVLILFGLMNGGAALGCALDARAHVPTSCAACGSQRRASSRRRAIRTAGCGASRWTRCRTTSTRPAAPPSSCPPSSACRTSACAPRCRTRWCPARCAAPSAASTCSASAAWRPACRNSSSCCATCGARAATSPATSPAPAPPHGPIQAPPRWPQPAMATTPAQTSPWRGPPRAWTSSSAPLWSWASCRRRASCPWCSWRSTAPPRAATLATTPRRRGARSTSAAPISSPCSRPVRVRAACACCVRVRRARVACACGMRVRRHAAN